MAIEPDDAEMLVSGDNKLNRWTIAAFTDARDLACVLNVVVGFFGSLVVPVSCDTNSAFSVVEVMGMVFSLQVVHGGILQ